MTCLLLPEYPLLSWQKGGFARIRIVLPMLKRFARAWLSKHAENAFNSRNGVA
jgi:hypothetical protein